MKAIQKAAIIASLALGSLTMTSAAQAAVTFNDNLSAPGVYYGTGNVNGSFTINNTPGFEMALRGKVFQGPSPTPVGNVYNFALGDLISFDWSFKPKAGDGGLPLDGLSTLLTIKNLGTGGSFSFNPFLVPDNATNPNAPGGFQNSWRLSFGFLNGAGGIGYDPIANSTYDVSWRLAGQRSPANSIILNQGTGVSAVPEPATWAMMMMGFALIGFAMRRGNRQKSAALA